LGCPRIAQQIALAFAVDIGKDVVRRVLATHDRPDPNASGPSWLTFLGHAKDSLWSVDLFRCEPATLRTHWVLVVMDPFTRRIVGFGVHAGVVDGMAHLTGLTALKELVLSYTQVTDAGLAHLTGLTALEHLYLDGTQVTDAGVAKLQQALPNCSIDNVGPVI